MNVRELRLDVLRGLALLVIYVDHVEFAAGASWISDYTLHRWYWCDAAEVFVFLAGLVCGRTYLRTLQRDGFGECQKKGWRRFQQLYLTNLTCLLLLIELAVLLGPPGQDEFSRLQYSGMYSSPWGLAAASATMLYQPMGMDILTLYMQFVLTLPALLWCWRRWPTVTKIACLNAYFAAQVFPCLNWPRWPLAEFPILGCGRHFHHLAWNCLFFLGVLVAIEPFHIPRRGLRSFLFCFSLTGAALIWASTRPELTQAWPWLETVRSWRSDEWGSKLTLGPARLIAFLLLAHVVSVVITERFCRRFSRLLEPVAVLGRHSLFVFSLGLLVAHASWLFLPGGTSSKSTSGLLSYEIAGLGILWGAACYRELRQRAGQPAPAGHLGV